MTLAVLSEVCQGGKVLPAPHLFILLSKCLSCVHEGASSPPLGRVAQTSHLDEIPLEMRSLCRQSLWWIPAAPEPMLQRDRSWPERPGGGCESSEQRGDGAAWYELPADSFAGRGLASVTFVGGESILVHLKHPVAVIDLSLHVVVFR